MKAFNLSLQKKYKIRLNFESCLLLFYFAAAVLINLADTTAVKAFYYITFLACLTPLMFIRKRMPCLLLLLGLGMAGLCLINITLVGNLTYIKFFIEVASVLFAFIICNRIVPQYLLFVMYLNILIIVYHFLLYGVNQQVFVDCSNNYVSVILLAPIVIYYTLLERDNQNIPIFPACLVWLMSILGGGRGGFLSCSVLFWGLVFLKYFSVIRSKAQRVLLLIVVLLSFLPLVFSVIPYFSRNFSDYRIVSQFTDKGMESSARIIMWAEYTTKSVRNRKNLVLGTKLTSIASAKQYEGNLHNSFLLIHAYLGMGGLLFVVYWLVKSALFSIRTKKWVYLLCLVSFSLRGMTDHVFGTGRYTPIFAFLLLYPLLTSSKFLNKDLTNNVVCFQQDCVVETKPL